MNSSHTRFLVKTTVQAIRNFLGESFPEVRVMSVGRRIQIMKETGLPESVVERFSVRKIAGSHAIGHTRMALSAAAKESLGRGASEMGTSCGKSHVLNLEPEDLVALTVEAAAMAKVPLAGTDWIPGASRIAKGSPKA